MFDIGFWELLIIAVVILIVIGPERLPEVAKQAAFLIRKARTSMFQLRNEMRAELDGTPFDDLQKARQEISDLKNDIKQFGRDLADSAESEMTALRDGAEEIKSEIESQPEPNEGTDNKTKTEPRVNADD